MAQRPLTFGALLSDLLSNANLNFQDLYNAVSAIQEDLADGSNKAVVYPNIDAMVEGLNSNKMADGTTPLNLAIGDDILIIAEGVPDFWISAKNASSVSGTAPSTWEVGKKYTFGYYDIIGFESGTSLVGYQTVGNMQGSISANDAYNNTKYPSVQAIIDYIESLGFAANGDLTSYLTKTEASGTYLTKNEASGTYLTKNDASNNYATKEELEDAGKVKGVSVNGHEVALDANGIAPITIDDIESGFTECTTFEQISVKGTTYYAIKVDDAVPALEVYNSSKQQIMTQSVVQNGYMYYCIGTSNPDGNTYYLRQLNGSTVNIDSGSGSGSVDLSNYYTKSEVDSKISSSGGGSGVTVSSITAGNPTDVTVNETSYTQTPVTFNYSDGTSKTANVKAKNGSGHELSFETVEFTLGNVTVPMETIASLNGYKAVYMVEGADLSPLMTTIGNTLELRILVSITNPDTESLMTLGRFVLYPNSAGVSEGFGVIRGLSEGNTTYNIGTCYYNAALGQHLYFCEPEAPNNGSIDGEWPSSDSSWSVTGPDGTEYTTTNCDFKIEITRVKFS